MTLEKKIIDQEEKIVRVTSVEEEVNIEQLIAMRDKHQELVDIYNAEIAQYQTLIEKSK